MVDKIVLDSLDPVPEGLRPFFKEVEGKFEFTPPKEDNSGLKSALAKAEREAGKLKKDFDDLKQRLTIDGEEVTTETLQELIELRTKQKEQEGKQLVPKAELDRLIAQTREQLTKKHDTEKLTLQTENQTLKSTLEKVLIEGGIRTAAVDKDLPFRLKPGAAEALVKIAKADGVFKIVDGKAIVMNGDGPKLNGKGDPMGPTDWILEQITANPFLAEDSTGAGTLTTSDRTVSTTKLAREMSEQEKIVFIEKNGLPKWQEKLMKERGRKPAAAA